MGGSENIEIQGPASNLISMAADGNMLHDNARDAEVIGGKSSAGLGDFGPHLRVTLCILFTELCERLTFYSVAGNLLLFCTQELETTSAQASSIVLAFSGTLLI